MGGTVERYQVKAAFKDWNDPGPDLLRKDLNAVRALRSLIGPRADGLYLRRKDGDDTTDWVGPRTKGEVMDVFRHWQTNGDRPEFVVATKDNGTFDPFAQVRKRIVPLLPMDHCTQETIVMHSLVHARFPDVIHSGGFLYRQIDGSTAWSDHAWGTATDESKNDAAGQTNDETFDWLVRMAQSGNMDYDYALGSSNGNVVQCSAPDYRVEPSSAASSHLWHCHISQVDHDGRKPPRNPMVP